MLVSGWLRYFLPRMLSGLRLIVIFAAFEQIEHDDAYLARVGEILGVLARRKVGLVFLRHVATKLVFPETPAYDHDDYIVHQSIDHLDLSELIEGGRL